MIVSNSYYNVFSVHVFVRFPCTSAISTCNHSTITQETTEPELNQGKGVSGETILPFLIL